MTLPRLSRRHEQLILGRPGDGVKSRGAVSESFDKTPQLLAPARVAQLAQRFSFNLTNTLSRDFKVLADFFQRVIGGFADAEPLPQHLLFARCQRFQGAIDLALEIVTNRRFQRRNGLLVLDEVAQVAVFLFADRRFERNRLARDFQNLSHFVERKIHSLGDFFRGWFAPELLHQVAGRANELIDRFDHVYRDADRPRLVRDGACDRLTNPPGRIGAELIAALVFKLVDRLHQADVALLDQIQELQAAVGIFLGDADDETEVRFHQFGFTALDLLLRHIQVLDGVLDFIAGN